MLLPLPETLSASKATALKAITRLIASGLAAEVEVSSATLAIRSDDASHIGAAITEAGLTAIGIVVPGNMDLPAAADTCIVPAAPIPTTKSTLVLSLLRREQGATLAELVGATGWLPHTTRGSTHGAAQEGPRHRPAQAG